MNNITEYDGYKIETPYIGKELSEEEKKELAKNKEEARKKALEMLKDL